MALDHHKKVDESAFKSLVQRVHDKKVTKDDSDLIVEYITERRAQRNLTDGRVAKIIYQLILWRKFSPEFRTTSITDIYAGIEALKNSEYSKNSKYDTVSIIKPFFQWMIDEGYSKVSEKKLRSIRRPQMDSMTKTAADMLTYDEIERIMSVCQSSRDRAVIMTLYEGGLRIGELGDLEWGDVQFDEFGIVINVNKKTGKARYVRCVTAREYLAQWKNDYPFKPADAGSPVFVTREKSKPDYDSLLKQIKRLAERAKIPHNISPHTFRHSRITHLIQEGVNESVIKLMMWGNLSTDMFSTYAHLTNADIDRSILEVSGMRVPNIKKPRSMKPVVCPTCQQLNGSTDSFCKVCGTDLTERGRMNAETFKRLILQNPDLFADALKEFQESPIQK